MGERRYKLAPSWRGLATQAHADCRFVTIIIGAIRVNDLDMRDPSSVSQVVEGMIAGFRRDWSGLTKGRAFPGLWWRGQFELELHREIPRESHREALLKDLGLDVPALGRDERVLVVHVHLVAVLPPICGLASRARGRAGGGPRSKGSTPTRRPRKPSRACAPTSTSIASNIAPAASPESLSGSKMPTALVGEDSSTRCIELSVECFGRSSDQVR